MALSLDTYNFNSMVERQLLSTLKDKLTNNLVDRLVAEFKETAEQEVKKEVEKLSINGIESFRNLAKMRDEIKIYCEWKA
tara:strand:- start:71 stop:310 length:240 start_codon:yes stop_codon:yes gene_type:complete